MMNAIFAIFGLGPMELVIVIGVVVLLFLPALLPKIIKRFSESVTTIRNMTDKDGNPEEDKTEETKPKE